MFKPGDILLYKATSWKLSTIIPKLIQLITGNKITHVGLYLGQEEDKHVVLDALAKGGIKIKYFTDIEIHTRKDDFILHGIARLPVEFDSLNLNLIALRYSNKPYGFLTIINLLLQHGKTRLFPNKKWAVWIKSNKGHICSEVSQLVLEEFVKETFQKEACLVEPDEYLSFPWEVILL